MLYEIAKQIVDQSLHFTWAFVALSPIVRWGPSAKTFAFAGFLIAMPRELVDQWPIDRVWDTLLDMSFFVIGGYYIGKRYERKVNE
jgi:hypothetical protein